MASTGEVEVVLSFDFLLDPVRVILGQEPDDSNMLRVGVGRKMYSLSC